MQCSTAEKSAEALYGILNGEVSGAKADIVLVNAAAGIIVGGKAIDFKSALEIARESVESGAAYAKLKSLVKVTNGNIQKLEEMESKYA